MLVTNALSREVTFFAFVPNSPIIQSAIFLFLKHLSKIYQLYEIIMLSETKLASISFNTFSVHSSVDNVRLCS